MKTRDNWSKPPMQSVLLPCLAFLLIYLFRPYFLLTSVYFKNCLPRRILTTKTSYCALKQHRVRSTSSSSWSYIFFSSKCIAGKKNKMKLEMALSRTRLERREIRERWQKSKWSENETGFHYLCNTRCCLEVDSCWQSISFDDNILCYVKIV